jgi:hypothetical protein
VLKNYTLVTIDFTSTNTNLEDDFLYFKIHDVLKEPSTFNEENIYIFADDCVNHSLDIESEEEGERAILTISGRTQDVNMVKLIVENMVSTLQKNMAFLNMNGEENIEDLISDKIEEHEG